MSQTVPIASSIARAAAPPVLVLPVLLALVLHGGWQVQQSLQLQREVAPDTPLSLSPAGDPAPARSRLPEVADMHLFGEYREPAPLPPPPPVQIRESPPGLRLQGVFTSSEPADAAALIAVDGGGPARRFQPGDAIVAQAELVSVALDHVLLRRAGELQRLSLYHGTGAAVRLQARGATQPHLASQSRGARVAMLPPATPEAGRAAVVMERLRRLRAGGA